MAISPFFSFMFFFMLWYGPCPYQIILIIKFTDQIYKYCLLLEICRIKFVMVRKNSTKFVTMYKGP